MKQKNNYLQNFKQELAKTMKRKLVAERKGILCLDNLELVAEKLDKHSKKCGECKRMKEILLEYIMELQYLDYNLFFDPKRKHELDTLVEKKCLCVIRHLKKKHHYRGVLENRITCVFIGFFSAIMLLIVNWFIAFGWHWLLSFPMITISWLIGYTLDKRNIKKGWAI
ncbi:hypothetical protein [Microscilla marina]|uniref:Uncharacterized protein n=1 Tax=Microscilla marina ATCC 23134 TaxID=313606 RepID=A1ZPS8_MICM2|nr:hypothetical protein [Microscilla marina]EAY27583.1 hypothetical protein M23134_02830 [Microscilla marina ATCC 23134]